MEAASSIFYKIQFLVLIIKNPLFLNILVYFSFFVIRTMNKEPLKYQKYWNTVHDICRWDKNSDKSIFMILQDMGFYA